MGQEALGRLFDVGLAWAPVDSQTADITGKRISMAGASGCTILVIKAAGTANDDPVFDLQQHTAYTGGTTADLDTLDHYFVKQETALDNDESWSKVTQSAASEVTGNATSAESQALYVFYVDNTELSDGYTHISLNLADTGSAGAQLCAAVYILHDLKTQRSPENLGNLLNPGAANA
jgi:hypothetical protein